MSPGAIIRARLRAVAGGAEARLQLADQLTQRGARTDAFRQIAAAARDGLPAAQARLGLCYLRGDGVPPNLAEARHWLEQAVAAGDVTAATELAMLTLQGVSGPYRRGAFPEPWTGAVGDPDYQAAAGLARRAVAAGSAEAKALLALILRLAPTVADPGEDADALYEESAAAGWPAGQLGHATTLIQRATPDALREARALLTEAADAGLSTAHFLLGALAEAGAGAPLDMAAAVRHYRLAAEQGHAAAKTRLGVALLAGRGTERNLLEAETWLRRAANGGDALAAAVLGDFHVSSKWQPQNLHEAAHWYRHAAELGHPRSARVLARAIAAGAEGHPDPIEIAAWLETAIEGGEGEAWPELGGLIASLVLPPNQLPALHYWLQRMIREDHPEAGYYVGICVNNGIGTRTDTALARRYYLWAAGEGVIDAMVAAGEMLLNGRGGRADPELAHRLFEYAARRNHPGANYALGVLAGQDRDSAMVHFRRAADLGHQKARLMTKVEPVTAETEAA